MSRNREGSFDRNIEQHDAKFSRHKFIDVREFKSTKELLDELHAFCSDSMFDSIVETYQFDANGFSRSGHDLRDLLFECYYERIQVFCKGSGTRDGQGYISENTHKMLDNEVYYQKPMQPSQLDDAHVEEIRMKWDRANAYFDRVDKHPVKSNFPDIIGSDIE